MEGAQKAMDALKAGLGRLEARSGEGLGRRAWSPTLEYSSGTREGSLGKEEPNSFEWRDSERDLAPNSQQH